MKYAFIWRHRKQFKIARLCRSLGVSCSGFYDWLSRPESRHAVEDRELLRQIRALHLQARQAYGAFKTWKVLSKALSAAVTALPDCAVRTASKRFANAASAS